MRRAYVLMALGLAACGDGKKDTTNPTTNPNTATDTNQVTTPGGTTGNGNDTTVNPNDASVDYSGPTIVRSGRMLAVGNNWQFNWAGSSFTARPAAASVTIGITAPATKAVYAPIMDVYIDGDATKAAPIVLDGSQASYTVALPDTNPHLVSFVLRTEANYSQARLTFTGITATGGDLLGTPKANGRQIEFIGDSITNGYGARSKLHDPVLNFNDNCVVGNGNNTQDSSTESSNLAFSTLTAKAFNADFALVASSGRGLYRNRYTNADPNGLLTPTVPTLWQYTLHPYSDEQTVDTATSKPTVQNIAAWDANGWSPQVVVINLGTNDFGSDPNAFVAASYQSVLATLFKDVNAKYPQAKIFPMAGPMLTTTQRGIVKTAITGAVTDSGLAAGIVADVVDVGTQDFATQAGCEYHPLPEEHQAVATQLETAIKAVVTDWATN